MNIFRLRSAMFRNIFLHMISRLIVSALLIMLPVASPTVARENPVRNIVEGPVEAELISVIDGDTLLVNARPWPQHTIAVLVRIRGIDAPEMKSKCKTARRAAERAKQALSQLATGRIRLTNISGDKYFGRIVADVTAEGDTDIGAAMIGSGLAHSYDGGGKMREGC
jgi:micrococcal nuclease